MIFEVSFIDIVTHSDKRGFFREIIRNENLIDGIGQISHSLVYPGVVKAWHGHKKQFQLNYVVNGVINVVLYDYREKSISNKEKMEFLVGENQKISCYLFPPGVLHGYKCIAGPMNIIYVTSGIYNPEEEIKLEQKELSVNYDWKKMETS